jgi:putative tryptophan/tyrosine transport system substrate-binding protein
LLHELVPTASSIALLVNSPNLNAQIDSSVQAAARTLGLQLYPLSVSTERDFDAVLSSLMRLQVGGLIISPDPLFVSRSTQLAALTVRYGVPAISQFREFASAGGLMTYGGSTEDSWRQVGLYTGRILNGERPADLPVQQVTKVELIINLKTARVLDLTIPPGLLARADEVIE